MGKNTKKSAKSIVYGVSKDKKDELFEKYIRPNFDFIKSLTAYYTDRRQDTDANFNYVISQMYKYIASYNSARPLDTWLHIVTKRYCYFCNKQQAKKNSVQDGLEFNADGELKRGGGFYEINPFSLSDSISDTLYVALLRVPTQNLSPLLLQLQGYTIKEITEIEFKKGHIPRQSEELIRKRLALCRKELKEYLTAHGIKNSKSGW